MMDELILDIMAKSISINNDSKNTAQVGFEFYPSTKVFRISIYVNGKQGGGLTKSWSVDTTDEKSLKMVRKDLEEIELPQSDDDLLGD